MMSCHDVVTLLLAYQLQLAEVFPGQDLTFSIASQYSFITIDISKSKEKYAHLKFEIDERSAKLNDLYCEDRSMEEGIRKKVAALQWPVLKLQGQKELPYSDEIKQELATADKIAALGVNCTMGDNYRPGNFSKILLTEAAIELSQINYMNAKSLAHKNDYSLRSLVFTIPFNGGKTTFEFSDRSSENNRRCGDRIEEALNALSNQ
jgi:hypothetical protein